MKFLKEFIKLISDKDFWKGLIIIIFCLGLIGAGLFMAFVEFMAHWRLAFGKLQ